MRLEHGMQLALITGGQIEVLKEIGEGGQGIVYLVKMDEKEMALKWYTSALCPDYGQLQRIIESGSPSGVFLWPVYLTERQYGSFGYVMDLCPQGYYEFSKYLLLRVRFHSFNAILAAAMRLCDGFMMLHRLGFSYHDLNDGNFFIRPSDGDVLICDNDNVTFEGGESDVSGKSRYMAPEVVKGSMPNKYSDRFSLSLILFRFFFLDHPFEGAKVLACPCLTEKIEWRLFGSEAVFIYDTSKTNLPVTGIHKNVIRRWPVVPSLLRKAFIEQFDQFHLQNPQTRMIEREWKKVIEKVRDQLVICPHCHNESFIDLDKGTSYCMECGYQIDVSCKMILGNRKLVLTEGTKLYLNDDNVPEAIVESAPEEASRLAIRNLTNAIWNVITASGRLRTLPPNELFPVRNGIKISFPSGVLGSGGEKSEIIVKQF